MGTDVNVDNFVAAQTARMLDTPSVVDPIRAHHPTPTP